MTAPSRGRRPTSPGTPASGVAELEAQRQAQLAAVAEVEASMAGSLPDVVIADDQTEFIEPLTPEQEAAAARAADAGLARKRYLARVQAMPADEPRWVVGARAKGLQVEGHPLVRGDVVPGAQDWQRRDAWVSAGYIERG